MTTTLVSRNSLLSDLENLERIWATWSDYSPKTLANFLPRKVNNDSDHATIKIELPGVDPSEVKVRVEGSVLRVESPKGNSNVPIGEEFDPNQTTASLKYGLLTVNIPRKNKKVLDIVVET